MSGRDNQLGQRLGGFIKYKHANTFVGLPTRRVKRFVCLFLPIQAFELEKKHTEESLPISGNRWI